MKKSKIFIIVIIIVVICGIGYYFYNNSTKKSDRTKKYTSIKVTKDPMEIVITATGVVQAIVQINVKSEIGGKVIKLPHEEGEIVKAGDLLAVIDDTQLKQTTIQTESDYRSNSEKFKEADTALELEQKNDTLAITARREDLAKAELTYSNIMAQLKEQKVTTDASIEQSKSALEIAQKQLQGVAVGSRTQQIAESLEAVNQAKVTMDNSQTSYDRQKELYSKDYVSHQAVDDAEKAYLLAKSQYTSAKSQYDMIMEGSRTEDIDIAKSQVAKAEKDLAYQITKGKQDINNLERALEIAEKDVNAAEIAIEQAISQSTQIGMKGNELSAASAIVDKSKSSYDQALDQLSKTKILSPVNALITSRLVEVGDVVSSETTSSAAGTTLMTIADLGQIYALTNIDESDIGKIRLGLPVTLVAAAYPDLKVPGVITHITPQATQIQQIPTFQIRITILSDKIPEKDIPAGKKRYELFYPGMSVDADIFIAKKDSTLQLPREAVWEKNGKKYVTLISVTEGKHTFKDVEVTTGLRNNIMVELLKGVKEGDEVKLPDIQAATTPTTGGGPGGGGLTGTPRRIGQ